WWSMSWCSWWSTLWWRSSSTSSWWWCEAACGAPWPHLPQWSRSRARPRSWPRSPSARVQYRHPGRKTSTTRGRVMRSLRGRIMRRPTVGLDAATEFLVARFGDAVTDVVAAPRQGMWSSTFFFRDGARELVVRFADTAWNFEKDQFFSRYSSPELPIP